MKHIEVYKDGEDNGWLHKQNFWFDPSHEHGFAITNLDSIYPEKYFEADHVKPETIDNYARLITHFFHGIANRDLERIIEFGTGGGWFGKKFASIGVEIWGLEGAKAGHDKSKNTAAYDNLFIHDFRKPFSITFKKDFALCTEVAEHIEPPFSSVLVKSLCDASDLVWFSSEEPNTNPAHIHHPNEMPDIFWINLFEFYGYGCYRLPQWVLDQTEGRGKFIFYNKKVYEGNQFLQQQH